MQALSPIQELRQQLQSAKAIAEGMLTQPIEPSIAVSYARRIIAAWDGLNHVDGLCVKIETELKRLEEELTIRGHFEVASSDTVEVPSTEYSKIAKTGTARPLRIEVSEGMIRQNLLTLTKGVKRGLMKVREEIQIRLPNGELLKSRIMPPGNRLQERGGIRRLYLEYNVKAGDSILLFKQESGEWKMAIEPRGPNPNNGLSL
jgi:hypothetical protein